ncbi:hypothetical protein DUI87_25882 [Hirundo rustica rustica]|uniref:Uncharacterized protein n=1 Tax=Hirundo rustica rustica TaxID=333673 RepID=A0A3M0JBH2_HIRRU|nr:hypothetical protein DUI87_25882 [Hirundo rustica rustica]
MASVICKSRARFCSLVGCDFACIYMPLATTKELEFLLQNNDNLQFTLDIYPGKISIHILATNYLNQNFIWFPNSFKNTNSPSYKKRQSMETRHILLLIGFIITTQAMVRTIEHPETDAAVQKMLRYAIAQHDKSNYHLFPSQIVKIERMLSSAFLSMKPARKFLHLNKKLSSHGHCIRRNSKNLPTLSGEQLAKDLGSWEAPSGRQLLQYVDDLLISTKTQEACLEWMRGMGEPVIHECLEAIEATCSSCLDLKDTLLGNTETWSTDGSSCVISGRHAGLIHPVIQGMQMTAMPIDPELAAKGKPNSLMILKARPTHTQKKEPKEMLTEHKETTLAQEMLTKFEKECEKLDAAREMLEKLEADMRERENLDYWEYRIN